MFGFLVLLVCAFMALPAAAAPLAVSAKSRLYVWVDGQPHGRLTRGDVLNLDVEPGEHEVATSFREELDQVHCVGLVDVPESGAEVLLRNRHCGGLRHGVAEAERSAIGALLLVQETSHLRVKMEIDDVSVPSPTHETLYNVEPGEHVLTFYVDDATPNAGLHACTTPIIARRGEPLVVPANASPCRMLASFGPGQRQADTSERW